jgi:hypothetical protein
LFAPRSQKRKYTEPWADWQEGTTPQAEDTVISVKAASGKKKEKFQGSCIQLYGSAYTCVLPESYVTGRAWLGWP